MSGMTGVPADIRHRVLNLTASACDPSREIAAVGSVEVR
jgi:hypothetical protein